MTGPSDAELVERLAAALRDKGASPDDDLVAGRARFVEAVSRDPRSAIVARARARTRWMAMAATLALVVSVALGYWRLRPSEQVRFTVEGAIATSSGFVEAPHERAAQIQLNDGSTLALAPSARGRIVEQRARGIRFSVESGTVDVHVAKREGGADYQIDAGPYSVRVTGTRFDLAWDPTAGQMRLVMHEGTVHVTGPNFEEGWALRAGQTLDVSSTSGAHVTEADAPPAVVPSSTAAAPVVTGTAEPTIVPSSSAEVSSADPSPSSASSAKRSSWSEKVASGHYADVLSEADARGIDTVTAQSGPDDLMALADAARYGGRSDVANKALRAVRSRFAGTKSASTAAFLLGRMAEGSGQTSAAIGFYDATVAERGAFASEALGRKMVLVERTSGASAARPVAESYLKSYPRGPYAEAARAITK